jgi:hypothetical protein
MNAGWRPGPGVAFRRSISAGSPVIERRLAAGRAEAAFLTAVMPE